MSSNYTRVVTKTSPSPRRQRSARGEGGQVREELIDAAEQLLAELGTASAVSVAEIVRRVGVTAPMLYNHFVDKDALFVAVHTRQMLQFRRYLQRAGRGAANAIDAMDRRGRAYIRYATTHRDAYRILFMTPGALPGDPFDAKSEHDLSAFDDLVAGVQACMDEGSIPPGDAQLAARVVWAQVHGLAAMLITMPSVISGIGLQRLVDQLLASVDAGLRLDLRPSSDGSPTLSV
jgi:AcrR family transcriptional regulator